MSLWVQHILVLSLIAACLGYVAWHAAQLLVGRRGRIGSCCARGCPSRAPAPAPRAVFVPVEELTIRRWTAAGRSGERSSGSYPSD